MRLRRLPPRGALPAARRSRFRGGCLVAGGHGVRLDGCFAGLEPDAAGHLRGVRSPAAHHRGCQERRHAHSLHHDCREGPAGADQALRDQVRHQGQRLARWHRQDPAAHAGRSRSQARRGRRGALWFARDGSAGSRKGSAAGELAHLQAAAAGFGARAPAVGSDAAVSVGAGLQHECHQEGRPAQELRRPARPQVEGQARHRSQKPGLVPDRG